MIIRYNCVRDACLTIVIIGRERWDIAIGVGKTPCIQHARTFVEVSYVDTAPEVRLFLVVLGDDLYTTYALEEEGQVKAFVLEIEVSTERNSRNRRIDPVLVGFGDDTIAVEVAIADTTETCTLLNSVVIYLFLRFEDTVSDVTYLGTDGMSLPTRSASASLPPHALFGKHSASPK